MRLLLLLAALPVVGKAECGAHNWRRAMHKEDDFVVYGITQDCQIFFARSSQLDSLSRIKTDPTNNYCFPNLIQLQLVDNATLRLLIKQSGKRLCVLAINIPPLNILIGPNAFTYSLSSSMPYARCSHAAPPLTLDTDLAFPDSAYSDVIYFVDPTSSGLRWTARQFMLNENDTLSFLDKFTIHNGDQSKESPLANDFVVSLDAEKNFLFKRNRFSRTFSYECAFDLLFRPKSVVFGSSSSSIANAPNERSVWLNSLAVDKEVMVFAETDKQSPVSPTLLYVQSTQGGNREAYCVSELPYRVEVGLFSMRTMDMLTHKPLPKFGLARHSPPRAFRPRPHAARPAVPEPSISHVQTSSRLTLTTTTTTRRPTTTQTPSSSTVKELPTEPPDESEHLTDEEAELYDTDVDQELMTLPAPGKITGLPSTTAAAAASTTTPAASTVTSSAAPTGAPVNQTLQAKSTVLPSLTVTSLIPVVVALLALSFA